LVIAWKATIANRPIQLDRPFGVVYRPRAQDEVVFKLDLF